MNGSAAETQVGDHYYHLSKLDVRTQLQLVWRFGSRVGPYVDMRSVENPLRGFLPLFMTLSLLPGDNADYIVQTCLNGVQRKEGAAWAKLTASNGSIMFADLGVEEIHTLVDKMLEYNLGAFFATLRHDTSGQKAESPALSGSATN